MSHLLFYLHIPGCPVTSYDWLRQLSVHLSLYHVHIYRTQVLVFFFSCPRENGMVKKTKKKNTLLNRLCIFGYRGLVVFATRVAVFWRKHVKIEKSRWSRIIKKMKRPPHPKKMGQQLQTCLTRRLLPRFSPNPDSTP